MHRISIRTLLRSALIAAALIACLPVPAALGQAAPAAAAAANNDLHAPIFWIERAQKEVTPDRVRVPDDGKDAPPVAEQMHGHTQVAVAFARAGAKDAANLELRSALICAKALGDKASASDLADLVEVLARADQMPQAAFCVEEALKYAGADHDRIAVACAEALLRGGKLDEAMGMLKHQVKEARNRHAPETEIAAAYAKAGNKAKAEEAFKAAESDIAAAAVGRPGNSDRARWAGALVRCGELARAEEQAKQLSPNEAAVLYATLAAAHFQAGAKQKYEQMMDQALEGLARIKDVDGNEYRDVAESLATAGDESRVDRFLQKVPAAKGFFDAFFYISLAAKQAEAGDAAAAKASLTKGRSLLNPKVGEQYTNAATYFIARSLAHAGKIAEAREISQTISDEMFRQSLEGDIAGAQAAAGQPERAIEAVETMKDPLWRAAAVLEIAGAVGRIQGDSRSILKWIESISDRQRRLECYLRAASSFEQMKK